jgi:hypothetical protein
MFSIVYARLDLQGIFHTCHTSKEVIVQCIALYLASANWSLKYLFGDSDIFWFLLLSQISTIICLFSRDFQKIDCCRTLLLRWCMPLIYSFIEGWSMYVCHNFLQKQIMWAMVSLIFGTGETSYLQVLIVVHMSTAFQSVSTISWTDKFIVASNCKIR